MTDHSRISSPSLATEPGCTGLRPDRRIDSTISTERPIYQPTPSCGTSSDSEMDQPAYELDGKRRQVVLRAIQDVWAYKGWRLLAVHVREVHVHVVVAAQDVPEKVMHAFKAYASRALNAQEFDSPDRKRWTRHGSTRYLWDENAVAEVIEYVVERQGEPMEVYRSSSTI